MSAPIPKEEVRLPLEFADVEESLPITGFWLFLASDVVLFSCLFAVYAIYQGRVASGPGPAQLVHFRTVIIETLLLLTSSFTCGLATFALRRKRTRGFALWLSVTLLLGIGFVTTEVREFAADLALGATWHHSAFLSAFYTLIGTHGGHVSFGIVWASMLLIQILTRGITARTARRFYTFSLYWHFLDVIWIFIFTVVYLGGALR